MLEKPWKVGTDMFAATHVYDAGGDRITNDRMCGMEGWQETCHAIAALPDLIDACDFALTILKGMGNGDGDAANACRAALAKAKGEDNAERN